MGGPVRRGGGVGRAGGVAGMGGARPPPGTTKQAYDQSYENSTVRLTGSYSITIASAPVAHQL